MSTSAMPPLSAASYRDRKRYAWLLSMVAPLAGPAGPWLYLQTCNTVWLWAFLAFFYLGIPLLDRLFGEDLSNPPESAVPALEADRYYRYITWAVVPLLWAGFIFNVIFLATHALPWYLDAGMLYYRKDLLDAAGIAVPATWSDLVVASQKLLSSGKVADGFNWQDKQEEVLVCDLVEFIGGSPYLDGITTEPFKLDDAGWLEIPEEPGLGLHLDREKLGRYTADPSVLF